MKVLVIDDVTVIELFHFIMARAAQKDKILLIITSVLAASLNVVDR